MPETTSRIAEGSFILDSLGINISFANESTQEFDRRKRFISSSDLGLFRKSRTNKSILGRRGAVVSGKLTTPGGTFPAIPRVPSREALRATNRNLERFRSGEVGEIEGQLRSQFERFTNARETAVTRLRSLSPELFQSDNELREAERIAQQQPGVRRNAGGNARGRIRGQAIARNTRIGEITTQVEGEIDKEINRTQAIAIRRRRKERGRLLSERDRAAVEGTSGTTPLTVKFGRGKAQVSAATGNPTILQGFTPLLHDAQNLSDQGTFKAVEQINPRSIRGQTDLSRNVNATRLATERQRLSRLRNGPSDG